MKKTLKTLLLSLAFSDFGVDLFAQPFQTSLLVKWLQLKSPGCNAHRIMNISGSVFSTISFLGVVAVSVDRFLAVHLIPVIFRYQEVVTHKRVVVVVIFIWVFRAFVSLMILWESRVTRDFLISFTAAFAFMLTLVAYIRIYLTVRRHKNQMQSVEVHEEGLSGEKAKFAALIRSTVGIFYVYLVFLFCYLPVLICVATIGISGTSTALKRFDLFSLIPVYLNSSLNPVIYCWKMRPIQLAILHMLRKMSRNTS